VKNSCTQPVSSDPEPVERPRSEVRRRLPRQPRHGLLVAGRDQHTTADAPILGGFDRVIAKHGLRRPPHLSPPPKAPGLTKAPPTRPPLAGLRLITPRLPEPIAPTPALIPLIAGAPGGLRFGRTGTARGATATLGARLMTFTPLGRLRTMTPRGLMLTKLPVPGRALTILFPPPVRVIVLIVLPSPMLMMFLPNGGLVTVLPPPSRLAPTPGPSRGR